MRALTASRSLRLATLVAATLALSGCALMNSGKPSTMYRLGAAASADAAAAPANAQPVVIFFPGSNFDRQSEGDQILTVTGNQAAYIAQARWVAPAKEMFDSETIRQIHRTAPQTSVLRAGEAPRSAYVLAVDVSRFDAEYYSAGTAPVISIDGRARLMRAADRQIVGDWPITAREAAADNRVSEIVAAFDRATVMVTGQVAQFTSAAIARN